MIHPQAILDNVLIPLDFSSYSDLADDFAEELNQKANIKKFYLQHSYQAIHSYNMMKTYEQMRFTMEANTREAYERYTSRRKPDISSANIQPIHTLDENNSPAYHIHEKARKHYCDLIITRAKGAIECFSDVRRQHYRKAAKDLQGDPDTNPEEERREPILAAIPLLCGVEPYKPRIKEDCFN